MIHRHLNHQQLTLAAIDDIISRGRWADWVQLRQAVMDDADVRDKIAQVCQANIADPYAQRYHFWMHYVTAHRPTS
jgi:hypothetical protein